MDHGRSYTEGKPLPRSGSALQSYLLTPALPPATACETAVLLSHCRMYGWPMEVASVRLSRTTAA